MRGGKGARRGFCTWVHSAPLVLLVLLCLQLVNCKRMQVQVKNVVPSIAVDKTDGCVVYLSYASRGTQITTSKISEVNVSFPNSEAEDADWVSSPFPP